VDNFTYIFGAIDERRGKLVIYKETVTNNRNIEDLAKLYFKETEDIPAGGLFTPPIMDPKSGAKRDYNKKTLYDHFLDEGIAFQPGHVNLDARIFRLNTYFEAGRIEIFSTCRNLIVELEGYKFPKRTLTTSPKASDKPIDKNNHCINPLEWIAMALPSDPRNLLYGVYDKYGADITRVQPQDRILPHALQDDDYQTSYGGPYDMEDF
jgi:hypothetical protein